MKSVKEMSADELLDRYSDYMIEGSFPSSAAESEIEDDDEPFVKVSLNVPQAGNADDETYPDSDGEEFLLVCGDTETKGSADFSDDFVENTRGDLIQVDLSKTAGCVRGAFNTSHNVRNPDAELEDTLKDLGYSPKNLDLIFDAEDELNPPPVVTLDPASVAEQFQRMQFDFDEGKKIERRPAQSNNSKAFLV
jgi:hypothetical protein